MNDNGFVHPYIPNGVPSVRRRMLEEIGAGSVEEIYRKVIPDALLFKGRLDLPEAIRSEHELVSHVEKIVARNATTGEYDSFLGAGCYRHYVPAICDEIAGRAEFLTAYCGDTYSDHGKMQAIFEYTSMMGELLDMDVVSYTNYDGAQAAASSIRMALRLRERENHRVVLVPATMNPEIFSQVHEYCRHLSEIVTVGYDPVTGRMDKADLLSKLACGDVAAVYLENPSYLGFFEEEAEEIGRAAHDAGALFIVAAEVASLGIVEPPAGYGADIACGDIQPLGMHIQYGGGQAGFIATHNDERIVQEFPTYLYGICRTKNEGEFGWGRALNHRCSHESRENAREYFGTETGLWAITAAVYLALLGPQGMRELGETTIQNAHFAKKRLSEIPNVTVDPFGGAFFQEFVVNFDRTGMTVSEINDALLTRNIFGGRDLSHDFPSLGQSALYCFGETTTAEQVERLADALSEIAGGR